jgi:hypothetical protein
MLQDIRDSSRLLRREPGSTLAAVLLMALGIAGTTTMVSVAYSVLVRPLPWPDSEHLVRLEERRGDRPGRLPWTISNATYHALRENAATILGLGGWARATVTVTGAGTGVSSDPFARTREPRLYMSYRQSGGTLSAAIFAIRFEHHAELIASALRGMLREQDTSLAFDSMSTMDEQIMTSLGRPKAYVLLIGGFALFAAAIAGVGLFGVLSYMTSQRTREIGIRIAPSARHRKTWSGSWRVKE